MQKTKKDLSGRLASSISRILSKRIGCYFNNPEDSMVETRNQMFPEEYQIYTSTNQFVSVDKLLNVTTKFKGAWTLEAIDIQYELKKLKITQKSIACELGVSEMTVSKVIRKQIVSNRVMRTVSRIINKDHRAIFPEYYSRGKSWIMDFKGGSVFLDVLTGHF